MGGGASAPAAMSNLSLAVGWSATLPVSSLTDGCEVPRHKCMLMSTPGALAIPVR